LIPKGVPEEPKANTDKQVKSGYKNLSFSKSEGQGSIFKKRSAYSTKFFVFLDLSLSTTATKPSNSALTYFGSK
jgi:hypothetical protein